MRTLGNLWRRLVLPKRIGTWSLTSSQQRPVKTGGRLVKHARYYWLMLAESHLTRRLFVSMVRRIGAPTVASGQREAMVTAKLCDRRVRVGEVFVKCTEKTEFPGFEFLPQAKTAP
jgi:hypothetical protein